MNANNDEAFDAFVRTEGPALLRLAAAINGKDSAEDLLQTALAKTYARWSRVQSRDVPALYVRRILLNEATSGWRARRRRPPELLTDSFPELTSRDETRSILDRAELEQLLRGLGSRQRAVVVLKYLEDRDDDDIAALLGCTTATVRSQCARALANLRAPSVMTNTAGSAA